MITLSSVEQLEKESQKNKKFAVIAYVVFIVLFFLSISLKNPYIVLILVVIGVPGLFFIIERSNVHNKALEVFANENNFTFLKYPDESLRHAHFFTAGTSQRFSSVVKCHNELYQFSFFNFTYTISTGSGKQQRTISYPFIIMAIELGKRVPNVYIKNTGNTTIPEPFAEDQRISLNVDYAYEQTHFVYGPKQYEIEVLQLLDTSFVETFLKKVSDYDIEFFESRMYIYIPKEYSEPEEGISGEIKRIFSIYENVSSHLKVALERFSFEQIGDHSIVLQKDYGFRINGTVLKLILTAIIILTIIIPTFWPQLLSFIL